MKNTIQCVTLKNEVWKISTVALVVGWSRLVGDSVYPQTGKNSNV